MGEIQGRLFFTTDGYVVQPLFFPGGDIGRLAVCGTVNDLAMMGAKPLAISLGIILEEGLPLIDLDRVMESVKKSAEEAAVPVATGDTKVVEKGKGDGIYITTSGIGAGIEGFDLGFHKIKPGDKIIITGTIGDHGLTIMSQREGLAFAGRLASDATPLNGLVEWLTPFASAVRFMRDPTRAGVAGVLADIAEEAGTGIEIFEERMPVNPQVQAAADILGLDILAAANEGKAVIVAAPDSADDILARCKEHPLGKKAAIIGETSEDPLNLVELVTRSGGRRIVQMPYGEELPRIC
jgi:hydrogenase expression/formation protein HypE